MKIDSVDSVLNKYYVAALYNVYRNEKTCHQLVWPLHFHSIALALALVDGAHLHDNSWLQPTNQPADRNRIVLFYARINNNRYSNRGSSASAECRQSNDRYFIILLNCTQQQL